MELAEKMDMGHNQSKRRRQSSENVSTDKCVKMIHNVLFRSHFDRLQLRHQDIFCQLLSHILEGSLRENGIARLHR